MTRFALLAAAILLPAGPAGADTPPPVRDLPTGKPAAVLDLATRDGVKAVRVLVRQRLTS